MTKIVSIEGPVEFVDGRLMLRIPLRDGGHTLAPLTRGIGEIEGGDLIVVIKPWMAKQLRIEAGSLVVVDNVNGKFTITRSEKNDN